MAKFSLFDGGKVTVYTGPIHRVCADKFVLNKNGKIGFSKTMKKDKPGYFYLGDAKGGELINIDEGCVLPNREEAFAKCTSIVIDNNGKLMKALTGEVDPKEASLIYKNVTEESEVWFYDRNEAKPTATYSKKDFKEILRQAEEERAKRKVKNKK